MKQGMHAIPASVAKVVKVECPYHTSTQVQWPHQLCLFSDYCGVIVRHPLRSFVGIRTHAAKFIVNNFPALVIDPFTNLKEKIRQFVDNNNVLEVFQAQKFSKEMSKGKLIWSFVFILTGTVTRRVKRYIVFGEKYITGKRKRFRPHKVYLFLISITSPVHLAMSVYLSFRVTLWSRKV